MINNQYEVFWNPTKTFQKVFSDLKKAQKSIHIETFMFESDSTGTKLINILLDKAKKIKVTLIVDGYGLQNLDKKTKEKIKESKIKFIIFNPLWQNIKKFNIRKLFRSLPYRNHRKLTIIDNKIAYVGGMNYHDSELEWHDLFVRIKGPIIKQLVATAKEMTNITNRNFAIRQLTKIKAKKIIKFIERKINKKNTKLQTTEDCITRQIPLSKHRPLKKQLKQLLNLAKKEVRITTPYFIPDPQFHKFLRNTIKKGVNIKLIVPQQSDKSLADILTKMNLMLAFKEKIKIRFLQKMTHAKYIIADDEMCSFGSANMDYQSFYNNYELNITSKNKKLIEKLNQQFKLDWKKSKPFEIQKWNNRSRLYRLSEKIVHPFRKYF